MIFLADTLRTILCFCLFSRPFGCCKAYFLLIVVMCCFPYVENFFAISVRLFLENLQIKCIFARIFAR